MPLITRRRFLRTSLTSSAALLVGLHGGRMLVAEALAAMTIPVGFRPVTSGALLGTVPFVNESNFSLETPFGSGLGGRLVTDLSALGPDTLITPNEKFFIRTRFPDRLRSTADWKIRVGGLVETPIALRLDNLMREARPMGTHLIECSGNTAHRRFGLISTAKWTGIQITKVLSKARIQPHARRVMISGFDEHSQRHRGSLVGASWIFTFEQLKRAGAFLATGMNGVPLPKDHGYPVRFMMPGWYGCTCIKWVNEISLVDDTAPATDQMKEYAGRTHQDGIPKLAKDFMPANIDLAAMPVRVERWRLNGTLVYRVVGLMWGGNKPTTALMIRFNPRTDYVPVHDYAHVTNATWTIWSHMWKPTRPGRYRIQLQVDDPAVRTRRLDKGYYARTVEIRAV